MGKPQRWKSDPTSDEIELCRRGMDYYVAGRFSALPGRSPTVSANLLHHAVEMFLKAALRKQKRIGQLRAMRHSLRNAWRAFKAAFPDPRLSALDSSVKCLDRFEELRYPGPRNVSCTVYLKRAHARDTKLVLRLGGPEPRKYILVIEDIDELVKLIFEVGQMNPKFYHLPDKAWAILMEENEHPLPR